ncbi:MAG: alpha/beta hydrolase, partial [Sphingomonas sp.]
MNHPERSATIPARTIPVPRSISAAARTVLSRLVDEDGAPMNARYEMPSPDDVAGWMAMKAAADAHYAAAIKGLAGSLHSAVETIAV